MHHSCPPRTPLFASPGALIQTYLRTERQKAARAEAEAARLLKAARTDFELKGRLLDAQMRKVSLALKQKGYRDSYWRPRLEKVQHNWMDGRLHVAESHKGRRTAKGGVFTLLSGNLVISAESKR